MKLIYHKMKIKSETNKGENEADLTYNKYQFLKLFTHEISGKN